MAKKKGGGGDEGGNWMDTYGDLVTLLMTFFVLLYSMSSLDQSKWELFVKSIYPGMTDSDKDSAEMKLDAQIVSTSSVENIVAGESTMPENSVDDVNSLYIMFAQQMDAAGISDVQLSRGKDYTFIEFKNKAFFEGDSSALTASGRQALDIFCAVLAPEKDQVSQINIMGHTAAAQSAKTDSVRGDRMLASMRAAEVLVFIQEKNVIEPAKLVSMEYGEYRPIADNSTEEGRAANRRVEILLIDAGAEARNPDEYIEEMASGANSATTVVTDGDPNTELSFGEEAAASAVGSP